MDKIINEIEDKYPVEDIQVDQEQVWPYLRMAYRFNYVNDKMGKFKLPKNKFGLFTKVKVLKDIFFGFRNWFSRYDFLILTDTSELKFVNGEYINKLTHYISKYTRDNAVLTIEKPNPKHLPGTNSTFKAVVSDTLLMVIKKIIRGIKPKRLRVNKIDTLAWIKKEYAFDINNFDVIRSFLSEYNLYRILFRVMRPKAVFMTCHSYIAARKAANDLNIKTVEIQHGSTNHVAYNSKVPLDITYYPRYLLVFGKHDHDILSGSTIYPPKNIRVIGSYYIDYLYQHNEDNQKLSALTSNYRKSIGITLQWTTEGRLIPFLTEAAALDPSILYVLIPRPKDESDYTKFLLPKNVILYRENDFYQTIKHLDFHATVFSTCALEAPSLGIQNILIDIESLAKTRYGEILVDDRITRYVKTPTELVDTINIFEKLDKDTIRKLNNNIIANDYNENMRDFLTKLIQ